jgi:outer membrane protein OmpA-like peptidoglycan-associated protein
LPASFDGSTATLCQSVDRRDEPDGRVRFLTPGEVEALLAAVDRRDEPSFGLFVRFGLITGARRGETLIGARCRQRSPTVSFTACAGAQRRRSTQCARARYAMPRIKGVDMNQRFAVSIACTVALAAGGCASMTEGQQTTTAGAAMGALGGAVIGGAISGPRGAWTGAALGGAAGAGGGYLWSKKMEDQKRAMQQATQGTGVAVTQTPDNQLKLEVPSDVSFRVGRADIEPGFRPVLDRFAQTLVDNPQAGVRVVGHTDSTGTDAINDPLSVNRAASVRSHLVDRGVAPQRIAIDGRGSREPIADNTTEVGRARNRRVEIFVGEPQQAIAPAPANPVR